MERKVVVTGMGMVSPLGLDVNTSWQNLIDGKSGIVSKEMPFVKNIKVAGLIKNFDDTPKGFNPRAALEGFVLPKDHKRISRPAQFSTTVAIQACKDADLLSDNKLKDEIDSDRLGVIIGTGIGGAPHIANLGEKIRAGGESGPSDVLLIEPERVASVPSMALNAKGPLGMVSAACASGNLAIANGYDQILLGNADIMIVGGTESAVDFVSIDAFDGVKALSQEADPEKACRPFDKKRSGFVMGEGAAVIILEEKEHAKKRGAKILAELVGYGNTSDAYHDTVPSGKGAEKAMEIAIRKMGGLSKEGLIYIHTHGTGTLFDYVEVNAIREVIFNDHQHRDVAISSTKGATGHTVGAAGAMGAIFSIQALNKGILPPTICLENPMDEAAGIDLVPNEAKKAEPTMVLNNSFGFGGFNVVTIFKRSEG